MAHEFGISQARVCTRVNAVTCGGAGLGEETVVPPGLILVCKSFVYEVEEG